MIGKANNSEIAPPPYRPRANIFDLTDVDVLVGASLVKIPLSKSNSVSLCLNTDRLFHRVEADDSVNSLKA